MEIAAIHYTTSRMVVASCTEDKVVKIHTFHFPLKNIQTNSTEMPKQLAKTWEQKVKKKTIFVSILYTHRINAVHAPPLSGRLVREPKQIECVFWQILSSVSRGKVSYATNLANRSFLTDRS